MGRIHLRANKAVPHFAKATLLHRSPHSLTAEFALFDADGRAIAVISEARFRAVRLHRHRASRLHYLDYHLTAAPLRLPSEAETSIDLGGFNEAITHRQNEAASLRYNEEIEPLLDSLCNQFILEALTGLCDESGTLAESYVNSRADADPDSAALLRYMISVAAENRFLEFVADHGWRVNQNALQQEVCATDIWNTLVQEYPDYFYLIHLVGRVGLHLGELLGSG